MGFSGLLAVSTTGRPDDDDIALRRGRRHEIESTAAAAGLQLLSDGWVESDRIARFAASTMWVLLQSAVQATEWVRNYRFPDPLSTRTHNISYGTRDARRSKNAYRHVYTTRILCHIDCWRWTCSDVCYSRRRCCAVASWPTTMDAPTHANAAHVHLQYTLLRWGLVRIMVQSVWSAHFKCIVVFEIFIFKTEIDIKMKKLKKKNRKLK